tara:strand:+ start:1741 stop:1998 length:258 start_codon:yes stop_codon:yes gene_type:complete
MPSNKWIINHEHEKLGQSVKEKVNSFSTEELGSCFEKFKISLEVLELDGRFSKKGIQSLESVLKLMHQLLNHKNEIIGEKLNENA